MDAKSKGHKVKDTVSNLACFVRNQFKYDDTNIVILIKKVQKKFDLSQKKTTNKLLNGSQPKKFLKRKRVFTRQYQIENLRLLNIQKMNSPNPYPTQGRAGVGQAKKNTHC
ncbi:MAG: hypothetical protein L3J31_09075 [Bacteroidales bacterium]|nr:hypothetical protein [Bacteroidales bacterium]